MKRSSAFTLIELLIAVSIFSVIAICLYSIFSGGVKIWRKQEEGFRYVHSTRLALDKMAKELRNAISYSTPEKTSAEGAQALELRFAGEKQGVSFVTVIGSDIAKVSYIFDANKGFLKRRLALQKEGFNEEEKRDDILITDLKDLSFEYAYGSVDKDILVDWKDSWVIDDKEAKAKLPKGVRITLVFGKSGVDQDEIFKKTVFMPMAVSEK